MNIIQISSIFINILNSDFSQLEGEQQSKNNFFGLVFINVKDKNELDVKINKRDSNKLDTFAKGVINEHGFVQLGLSKDNYESIINCWVRSDVKNTIFLQDDQWIKQNNKPTPPKILQIQNVLKMIGQVKLSGQQTDESKDDELQMIMEGLNNNLTISGKSSTKNSMWESTGTLQGNYVYADLSKLDRRFKDVQGSVDVTTKETLIHWTNGSVWKKTSN